MLNVVSAETLVKEWAIKSWNTVTNFLNYIVMNLGQPYIEILLLIFNKSVMIFFPFIIIFSVDCLNEVLLHGESLKYNYVNKYVWSLLQYICVVYT